jgi:hypothetical protein
MPQDQRIMWRRKHITAFGVCLAIFYGLLITPWPGWRSTYGRFFRVISEATFGSERGIVIVRVRPAENPPRAEIDTQILLITRSTITPEGSARARVLGLDSRSVGWVPTALIIALASATPLPWRRRANALLIGIALVHVYLLFAVAADLWNQSAGLVPISFVPFWPALANILEQTFVVQLGPSFAFPVLIWTLSITAVGGWRSLWVGLGAKPQGDSPSLLPQTEPQ